MQQKPFHERFAAAIRPHGRLCALAQRATERTGRETPIYGSTIGRLCRETPTTIRDLESVAERSGYRLVIRRSRRRKPSHSAGRALASIDAVLGACGQELALEPAEGGQ